MADSVPLKIQGFPSSRRLGIGSNALLFLDDAREIREVLWISSAPGVASVTPMPDPSPCGSRCAWLSAQGCGRASIEVYVCFVDGSCRRVDTARSCSVAPSESCWELPALLTVC